MATDRGRFRADLIDLAWGEESKYGDFLTLGLITIFDV